MLVIVGLLGFGLKFLGLSDWPVLPPLLATRYHRSHDWNGVQAYEVCILVRLKRESRYRSRSYLKYRYSTLR